VEAALPLLLKQLKLARFRSHWQSLSQQAKAEGCSPSQFLYALCEQEVDHRQIARRQRLLHDAHLPWQKGLDGFDHQHHEAKHWQELQVLSSSHTWLLQAENLLLFGPSPPLPGKMTPLHFDHQGGLMEQSNASLQRGGQS
jgi:DNA replication protein DnaC